MSPRSGRGSKHTLRAWGSLLEHGAAASSLQVSKRDLGRGRKSLLRNGEQSHLAQGMDKLTSQAFSISGFWVPNRESRYSCSSGWMGAAQQGGLCGLCEEKKWMGQSFGAFPFHSTRTESQQLLQSKEFLPIF